MDENLKPNLSIINSEWIKAKMTEKKIKLKTIQSDTGIDKTYLSCVINGKQNLSRAMKALFYYYFKTK